MRLLQRLVIIRITVFQSSTKRTVRSPSVFALRPAAMALLQSLPCNRPANLWAYQQHHHHLAVPKVNFLVFQAPRVVEEVLEHHRILHRCLSTHRRARFKHRRRKKRIHRASLLNRQVRSSTSILILLPLSKPLICMPIFYLLKLFWSM